MMYEQETVLKAFEIYGKLSVNGQVSLKDYNIYLIDDKTRGLVDQFANEMDCTVITSHETLYLIPMALASPYHISNESLKSKYLTSKHQVADIYLMYFAIIILYGLFYDSYTTTEPVLEFVSLDGWLMAVNDHVESLNDLDEETLKYHENDMNYNWMTIISKWLLLDDVNEKSKVQDGRTSSRVSFLNLVSAFMLEQDLIIDIGNMEFTLSEKSQSIIGHYFMEVEYNRGILELLYGGAQHADNIEN